MKFIKNDIVKITKVSDLSSIKPCSAEKFVDQYAQIIDIGTDIKYPNQVVFANEELNTLGFSLWDDDELELVFRSTYQNETENELDIAIECLKSIRDNIDKCLNGIQ